MNLQIITTTKNIGLKIIITLRKKSETAIIKKKQISNQIRTVRSIY